MMMMIIIISGILTTYLYTNNHLDGRRGHQKLPKISTAYRFNRNHLKTGANSNTSTNVSYSTQIPKTWP